MNKDKVLRENKKYKDLSRVELEIIRKELLKKIVENNIPNNSIKLSDELMRRLLLERFQGSLLYPSGFCVHNIMKEVLSKFDLSDFDWKDVVVSQLDFTNCNAIINPQIVHNRKLVEGIYPLDFTGMNFNYCDISNSDFRGSKGVVYNLVEQEYYVGFGSKGYYPITFIGNITFGKNDESFFGSKIISREEYYGGLMDSARSEIENAITKTLKLK